MVFRPNMTAFTDGIRLVAPLRWRAWDGTVADLSDAEGCEGARGHYLSPDPRVVVFLGAETQPIGLAERRTGLAFGKVAFIPAGLTIWSHVTAPRPFRHLDLHFEAAGIERRLRESLGPRAATSLTCPVFLDGHPTIEHLAGLLAAEVEEPCHDDLVPDGLATTILSLILGRTGSAEAVPRGGLTPAQLRRVTDLMDAELHRRLSVAELAAAAGLSESWFAHAFRATVGTSPGRHLMARRIERARQLLEGATMTIGEVAAATGFADQAHMTRAFRTATGATPAAWRRLTT
ncbi:AraC family transcriptional regulator [Rubellimicrobium rubrum]|nr:AraC family transcriptional regulator [Rubellimicrobium rubrum]